MKFKFEAGNFEQSRFRNVQSRNVETSKSSSGSYRYLTHTTTDKAMMEKKDKIQYKELLVAEYETDGQYKNLTKLELWYRDKSKEQYVPRRKLNLMRALQAFYKVHYREIAMS